MREILRYTFRKKRRALPCPYAEDYLTNQEHRAFFDIDSSDDLTYTETCWDTTFQT